jgi:hypothetical protein
MKQILTLAATAAVAALGTWLASMRSGDTGASAREPFAATAEAKTSQEEDLGPNARLTGVQLFPPDNAWNAPIDHLPVDERSAAYIASIGADAPLHPDFGRSSDGQSPGIPYVVVSGEQERRPVRFQYRDESDVELYPIPDDAPIEGGPQSEGDRHLLVLDRGNLRLYELFGARKTGDVWTAGSGAIFDLRSNQLRPAGWTSADAAGLPILPGLVRYDEAVAQAEIRHALRFTARMTRRAYVFPARHWASQRTDENLPPMGLRVRLKASYEVSSFPPPAQVILRALKKYGMLLADNGGNWFITGAPDSRWNDEELATLKRIKGKDLEVVQTENVVTP